MKTVLQAYPAKRFRSIWIGVVGHTLPSFVLIGIVLSLVLRYARVEPAGRVPRI